MVKPQNKFKKVKHRARKVTRESRAISHFRRIRRQALIFKNIRVKSDKRVAFFKKFLFLLKAKAKFLFTLTENFISQKFRQEPNTNIELDPFYCYYLKIINYKSTIESHTSKATDLAAKLKSQQLKNPSEIENYLQNLQ